MTKRLLSILCGLAMAGCASPPPPPPTDPQVEALKMMILEQIAIEMSRSWAQGTFYGGAYVPK